jgi:hypothetical protein
MTSNPNPGCLAAILRLFRLRKKPPEAPSELDQSEIAGFFPYRRRDDFLSPAEAAFFRVLKSMTGDKLVICPKVSLADLFFVPHREESQAYQNKLDRQRVDFVLCNPQTLQPVLAIELDDASPARPDQPAQDEFVDQVCAATGLPLVRVPVRPAYNTQELAAQFREALGASPVGSAANPPTNQTSQTNPTNPPICPKCGVPMVLRTSSHGATPGKQSYGCSNYPQCRVIIQVKAAGL